MHEQNDIIACYKVGKFLGNVETFMSYPLTQLPPLWCVVPSERFVAQLHTFKNHPLPPYERELQREVLV